MTSPAPTVERWVDARELAAIMGVSLSTVKRWRAEGMKGETWGMKRTVRYLPSEVMAWRRARAYDESKPGSRPQRARTPQIEE